jgi:hypothetical protein
MPILRDLLSEENQATIALSERMIDPFKFQPDVLKARHFVDDIDKDFDKIKWYKGEIKKGYGALEDGECYVAWHKKCALTVVATPRESRKYAEPGQPIFGYSFQFSVSGHCSGSSATLAGAIQEAALAAIKLDSDTRDSDSRWLNGNGGKKGFFEFHKVDTEKDTALTFGDLATEENLQPVPVLEGPYATEEATSNIGPRL